MRTLLLLSSLVLTSFVLPARATVSVQAYGDTNPATKTSDGNAYTGENYFDSDISNSDLINSGQSTYAGETYSGEGTSSVNSYFPYGANDVAGLNDGLVTNYGDPGNSGQVAPHNTFITGGASVTFNLNLDSATGGNPTGYDLSRIQVISGYSDNASAQDFTLTYTTISGQSFSILDPDTTHGDFVNQIGFPSDETEITDSTGLLASNVASITFTSDTSTVIREIDVFGDPAAVPEPSTYALLAAGVGLLAFIFRLRKLGTA